MIAAGLFRSFRGFIEHSRVTQVARACSLTQTELSSDVAAKYVDLRQSVDALTCGSGLTTARKEDKGLWQWTGGLVVRFIADPLLSNHKRATHRHPAAAGIACPWREE